ncbi:hypothetical protein [Halomarina litorea]|uniref:hypothetical protein n=1 Tax=Halomarina litorea TaxID=2961595 RepID=UPI0020C4955B|nr:hypothetical protein [Halomarina sp. BCD28]
MSLQRSRSAVRSTAFHQYVAVRMVDVGLAGLSPLLVAFALSEYHVAKVATFCATATLVTGALVYLPANFIGQELFDAGGLWSLPFVYGFSLAVALCVLTPILLLPVRTWVVLSVVLLVAIAGGRTEVPTPVATAVRD